MFATRGAWNRRARCKHAKVGSGGGADRRSCAKRDESPCAGSARPRDKDAHRGNHCHSLSSAGLFGQPPDIATRHGGCGCAVIIQLFSATPRCASRSGTRKNMIIYSPASVHVSRWQQADCWAKQALHQHGACSLCEHRDPSATISSKTQPFERPPG